MNSRLQRSSWVLAALPLALAACDDVEAPSASTSAVSAAGSGNAAGSSNAGAGGAAAGAGGGAAGGGAGSAGSAGGSSKPLNKMPGLGELPKGKLNKIDPGGDTICSRGDPFSFFVMPGATDKVIIEFSGGGACWNETTCGLADALFSDKVPEIKDSDIKGFYDHNNPGHPLKDWTHVFIPYCTGDIHWGNSVQTYGKGDKAVTINHKGAVNAQAVLSWVYENFASPAKTFVGGCSAGSYGSIMWSTYVREHYKDKPTKLYHFGDSGAGIITDNFFKESFPSWNVKANFPGWLGVDFDSITKLPQVYTSIANHHATDRFSQYNTQFDENQLLYYEAMGGEGGKEGWSAKMKASIKEIQAGAKNFRSFTAAGQQHCILPYDNFYTVKVGDTLLTDWLDDYVNDKEVPNLACPGCE